MDKFDIEFHFAYDKVKVELVADALVKEIAAFMDAGKPFPVRLNDYLGEPLSAYEIINPLMVTHMRVEQRRPF